MDRKRLISDIKWCMGQGYSKEETINFVVSLVSDVSRTDIAFLYDQLKRSFEQENIQNIPDRGKDQPKPKATLIGMIFIIGVVAIISTMCNTMCKPFVDKTMTDSDYLNDRVYCYVAAKDYIKNLLVSPASAKFSTTPIIRSKKESEGIFVYHIDSYVDSQNAFGAVLRTRFSVSVRYYKKQDKWVVYEYEFY